MAEDKRRFSRINYDVQASLIVDNAQIPVDRIINLSVGGCQIALQHSVALHTVCVFVLLIEGIEDGVQVDSEVVRCSPGEISLKFIGVEPQNLYHLHNILRYNAEDPEKIEQEIDKRPGLK
jgi:hypothetical protein